MRESRASILRRRLARAQREHGRGGTAQFPRYVHAVSCSRPAPPQRIGSAANDRDDEGKITTIAQVASKDPRG